MNHASLFSGIGGFDLAAEWAGWTNVLNCEIDPFCQNELKNHWLNAIQYSDIRKTDFTVWRGRIDVLTGGFPCQPFSVAGKRKGTDDDRHLWPEMLRAIREIAPRWVVGENVRGIVNWSGGLVFEQVCDDLEAEGYEVQTFILPACGVEAPHERYRCWFVAYSDNNGSHGSKNRQGVGVGNDRCASGAIEAEQSAGCADSYAVVTQNPNDIRRNGFESEEKSGFGQFGQSGSGNNGRIRSDDGKVGFASNRSNSRAETLREPEIGVLSDRNASDAASAGFQKRQRDGGREGYSKNGAGLEFWDKRFGSDRAIADADQFNGYVSGLCAGQLPQFRETGVFDHIPGWQNFPSQSPILLGDDGFPADVVRQRIREDSMGLLSEKEIDSIVSKALSRIRQEAIRAAGNAVVPPLVYQIFDSINRYEKLMRNT